jgi:hypothetical protein
MQRVLWCSLVIILSVDVPSHSQTQKPVVVGEVHVEWSAPPATLQTAVSSADAIFLGTVHSTRPFTLGSHSNVVIRTIYTFRIDDVIRPHQMLAGSSVDVYRYGGDVDTGPTIYRAVDPQFPSFSVGEQLVLFVNFNADANMFQDRGPDGAFRVQNAAVTSIGYSPVSEAQQNRSAADFIAQLKSIVAGP